MEITGKIIAVLEPKGGVSKSTGNEWKLQQYVIETHDEYPRSLCFDVFGEDKINQFNIQMNEELTVSFDINAREWNGKWFNGIRAWKVDRVNNNPTEDPNNFPVNNAAETVAPNQANFNATDTNDDLPF